MHRKRIYIFLPQETLPTYLYPAITIFLSQTHP